MSQMPTRSQAAQGSTKLVIIALVVAGVALLLVNLYIEYIRSQTRAAQFTIYRLNEEVEPGDTLEADMYREQRVPQDVEAAFADAIRTEDALDSSLGRTIQRYADAEDYLTYDLFTSPTQSELSQRIDEGNRLLPLPVDDESVPGGLRPGDYVDISALFGGGAREMLVMEGVRVMAIGDYTIVDEARASSSTRRTLTNFNKITIQVPREQVIPMRNVRHIATGPFGIVSRSPTDEQQPVIENDGINPAVLELIRQSNQPNDPTAQR